MEDKMEKGTHKSWAMRIVAVTLIAGAGLSISACDNKNTPSTPGTPNINAPTFTPAPLVSKRPDSNQTRNVDNKFTGTDDSDSYPAPAPVITSNQSTVSG
jgi:hypothetical protein